MYLEFYLFTNVWTGEWPIVCSQYCPIIGHTSYVFKFNLFIALLICLGLASLCLPNMDRMPSSVNLTLFMSSPLGHAKDSVSCRVCYGKLTSTTLCSCFAANHTNVSCFVGTNTYSIHWQVHLHNYKRYNTPFYTFNKDNIEYVS